jgi:hypothetical protein
MSVPSAPLILIYDSNGILQDIPTDIVSGSFDTVVNGGSGQGQMQLPRRFGAAGAIGIDYRVQVYLNDNRTVPWFDGRVTELNRKVTSTRGLMTVFVEGFHTELNHAVVDFTINPGVQSSGVDNGQIDYAAAISYLLNAYEPPGYTNVVPASAGVNVPAFQADNQGLSDALDAITKCVLDGDGSNWEWYCDGTAALGKVVTVQSVNTFAASPINLDSEVDCANYEIDAEYANMQNLVYGQGGSDPVTGDQIFGSFSDSTSIALYGVRQGYFTQEFCLSQAQLNEYATSYLAQNGYPTYTGTIVLRNPTANVRAGKWISVLEEGGNIRTMRCSKVTIDWSAGNYIQQTIEPTSPLVRIDKAILDTRADISTTLLKPKHTRPQTDLGSLTYVISGADMTSFTP